MKYCVYKLFVDVNYGFFYVGRWWVIKRGRVDNFKCFRVLNLYCIELILGLCVELWS